jgi:hypothetical protein
MIFTCPSCTAGHSVPVSMIPSGGMDMTCRRCSMAFHVDMPERTVAGPISLPPEEPDSPYGDEADETPAAHTAESTAVGIVDIPVPHNVEPTRIGVVMPDENPRRETLPPSLLSPAGQLYAPTSRFDAVKSEDTRPDAKMPPRRPTPVTQGRSMPPSAREHGLDPELDDTQRLDAEDMGLEENVLPKVEPRPLSAKDLHTHVGDLSQSTAQTASSSVNEREVSLGAGPNGLYERVAAGVYTPEEPKAGPVSASRVRAKSWDEPSAYVEPKSALARMLETFRRTAMVLNSAPLALKAALVVFPVTLGLALMLTSASDSAPAEPSVNIAPEEAVVETSEKVVEKTPPPKKLATVSSPDDAPAEEGNAYVQVERARLRAEPAEASEAIGRLEIGTLVRTYEVIDGFVLVMAAPKGPAGFISEKLIDEKKPIALLAKERAFAACEVTAEYTIDDCLYQGKQQHDACTESCGFAVGAGGEDNPALRCAEACKVAFNDCQRSCNGENEPREKKKTALKKRR